MPTNTITCSTIKGCISLNVDLFKTIALYKNKKGNPVLPDYYQIKKGWHEGHPGGFSINLSN